jgi:hypothetical protein
MECTVVYAYHGPRYARADTQDLSLVINSVWRSLCTVVDRSSHRDVGDEGGNEAELHGRQVSSSSKVDIVAPEAVVPFRFRISAQPTLNHCRLLFVLKNNIIKFKKYNEQFSTSPRKANSFFLNLNLYTARVQMAQKRYYSMNGHVTFETRKASLSWPTVCLLSLPQILSQCV